MSVGVLEFVDLGLCSASPAIVVDGERLFVGLVGQPSITVEVARGIN
jgi:hypothetical protein